MKAVITSIGEPTTDLCKWALERNGFEVTVLQNPSSLARKLKSIYQMNEDFLRVDADVIVNRNMTPELLERLAAANSDIWWWQFTTFDWFQQDINYTLAYIRKEALPHLRNNIDQFLLDVRAETQISRIKELYGPRRMETYKAEIMGLHGYGTKDLGPVKKLKAARGQLGNYDFELTERLNAL